MSDFRKRALEARLKRCRGMSAAASQAVNAHMMSRDDLYSVCPRCGRRRHGNYELVTSPCGCENAAGS